MTELRFTKPAKGRGDNVTDDERLAELRGYFVTSSPRATPLFVPPSFETCRWAVDEIVRFRDALAVQIDLEHRERFGGAAIPWDEKQSDCNGAE